ncbi:hypothetical protein [Mucilaginibacter psychrotolerans]|uniref:Uncharacterized protein n=1 Tax=Mucilaginibacter psychrotolerans TaxID=1524096 RepID=A0A4Y8SJG9_9SPHI|nr:hypothetical protein [Mucilaginibacter psychrotolerans]TFF39199.1 hypothetical protein E2R66_06145 [Mucilaginibacter psychrotolerans]
MAGYPPFYTKEELAALKKRELEHHIRRLAEEDLERQALLTAERVCVNARESNCWVYDPETKTWYSPEEFLVAYGRYFAGHPLFNRVQLRNPVDGLNAGYKQLERLHTRLLAFTQRVMAYYAKKA